MSHDDHPCYGAKLSRKLKKYKISDSRHGAECLSTKAWRIHNDEVPASRISDGTCKIKLFIKLEYQQYLEQEQKHLGHAC